MCDTPAALGAAICTTGRPLADWITPGCLPAAAPGSATMSAARALLPNPRPINSTLRRSENALHAAASVAATPSAPLPLPCPQASSCTTISWPRDWLKMIR
nr:hypothetical protein [Chromobacterium violaceum]